MKQLIIVLLLTIVNHAIVRGSDAHFKAAVVEFSSKFGTNFTGEEVILENVDSYIQLITTAKTQGADIIVFPEYGLTGVFTNVAYYIEVPHPDSHVSPCVKQENWSAALVNLSCAARSQQIYVVVNLKEQDGKKRFNTNVVFNRAGVVVSRYRKLHLFGESDLHVPEEKDFSVFDTDFGVTFGSVICFDLLFHEPANHLMKTRNIRHFVFPTAWFSEVPFYTALQTQAAWSWSNNAVLLAAEINAPHYGCTGSGIYAGRYGPVKTFITGENTTRLLIADVPKDLDSSTNVNQRLRGQLASQGKHRGSLYKNLHMKQDHVDAFTTELLPSALSATNITRKLCHGKFCCQFDIEMKQEPVHHFTPLGGSASVQSRRYRLVIWDGVRDHSGFTTTGVQLCGVIACNDGDSVKSCGWPLRPDQSSGKVMFSQLHIRGMFENDDKSTMLLANTMGTDMDPLPIDSFELTRDASVCKDRSNHVCTSLRLLQRQEELQAFALYNRIFSRDSSNYTHPKAVQ